MSPLVNRLYKVYKQELEVYKKILEAAFEEKVALQNDRPLSEIIEHLKNKRALIRRIESLDGSIIDEKEEYKVHKRSMSLKETHELSEIIEATRDVIENIISVERESENIILGNGQFSSMIRACETGVRDGASRNNR